MADRCFRGAILITDLDIVKMNISEQLRQELLRGEELLWLCQDLQSEKDGIARPRNVPIDKAKPLDDFAKDIRQSVFNMTSLLQLIPMREKLTALGRKLEAEGSIPSALDTSYSEAALQFILEQHGLSPE